MSIDDTLETLRREVAELRSRFERLRADRREERRTARRETPADERPSWNTADPTDR
ncbi:MAG TPA: hypothetical protein VKU61_09355 [Candidatus Binatia bacterium]|nr:hypothetical protein [Candidatus Binatia bacterium]